MTAQKILLIDDDPDLRSIFAMALELEGYTVIEAENGKIALEMLMGMSSEELPDCMILDIMMPVMDGHTFLKTLHYNFKATLAKIPIVVASAHGHFQVTPQVIGTLTKPVSLDALFKMMENLDPVRQREAETFRYSG